MSSALDAISRAVFRNATDHVLVQRSLVRGAHSLLTRLQLVQSPPTTPSFCSEKLTTLGRSLPIVLALLLCLPTVASANSIDLCRIARFQGTFPGDRLGHVVVAEGTRFAIGVPGRAEVWVGSVDQDLGSATIDHILKGPRQSQFGVSVAIDGERLLVGSPLEGRSGRAWLFALDNSVAVARLESTIASDGAWVGFAVALQKDRALIAAPLHDPSSMTPDSPQGAIFSFRQSSQGWIAEQTILPPNGPLETGFGESLALAGKTLAVGAPRGAGAEGESGITTIYRLAEDPDGAHYTAICTIAQRSGRTNDGFGSTLGFIGNDLAIGAPHHDQQHPSFVSGAGAVSFVKGLHLRDLNPPSDGGMVPILFTELTVRRRTPTVALGFGGALASYGDVSSQAPSRGWIVGSPSDSVGAPLAGSISLFSWPINESALEGQEVFTYFPEPASSGSEFGRSIASGDGFLLVGAPRDAAGCGGGFGCSAGAVEVFLPIFSRSDCDGDGIEDRCALLLNPGLDPDGDGIINRCMFRRGDLDGDGSITLADPIVWLIARQPSECVAARDANGDGIIDLSDPLSLLEHLFLSAPRPPPPYDRCGIDRGIDHEPIPCANGPGC